MDVSVLGREPRYVHRAHRAHSLRRGRREAWPRSRPSQRSGFSMHFLLPPALLAAHHLATRPAVQAPDSSLRTRVAAWRAGREGAIVREFVDLLAIPNLAADSVNIRR